MSVKPTRREWLKISAISTTALTLSSFDLREKAEAQTAANKLIKLSSNENPYGFSQKAKQAILDNISEANRYANPSLVAKLEQQIAEREGLKAENVILGTGSGEVLCMAAIAFGQKEIVAPDPTFPSLMFYAEKLGAKIRKIPLNERFEHDLGAMLKAIGENTSLVYICNPNNPTASITPSDTLRAFCSETAKRTLVFADEAYLEYTEDFPRNSLTELVKKGENVIVSRTFSKIYGLAGLRVGYGLAKAEIARKLKSFRMTWLNNLTLNAALAAYEDQNFVAESRKKNADVCSRFLREISSMKLNYAPTSANFVWLNVGTDLNGFAEKMRENNIWLGNPQNGWARVTIGTSEEMQAFIKALKKITNK